MKNMYEGMFILLKSLDEESLEKAMGTIRDEIGKLGGDVKSVTRLGKRGFARLLKKQDAGHYVVMVFDLDGDKLISLQARLKLNDDVLRAQFIRVKNEPKEAVEGAKEEVTA